MTIAKILKWLSGAAGIALVIYILAIVWTLNAYRFKITDPKDPGFRVEDFRFEDYFLDETISEREVRRTMFPPGTDRVFVDRILINGAGAEAYDYRDDMPVDAPKNSESFVSYRYDPWWNTAYKIFGLMNGVMFDGAFFGMHIYYDTNHKVVEVR